MRVNDSAESRIVVASNYANSEPHQQHCCCSCFCIAKTNCTPFVLAFQRRTHSRLQKYKMIRSIVLNFICVCVCIHKANYLHIYTATIYAYSLMVRCWKRCLSYLAVVWSLLSRSLFFFCILLSLFGCCNYALGKSQKHYMSTTTTNANKLNKSPKQFCCRLSLLDFYFLFFSFHFFSLLSQPFSLSLLFYYFMLNYWFISYSF